MSEKKKIKAKEDVQELLMNYLDDKRLIRLGPIKRILVETSNPKRKFDYFVAHFHIDCNEIKDFKNEISREMRRQKKRISFTYKTETKYIKQFTTKYGVIVNEYYFVCLFIIPKK